MKLVFIIIIFTCSALVSLAQPIETIIEDAVGSAVVRTNDGGYAVAGNAFSLATASPYLVKLRADGTIEWSNVIWNSYFSIPTSVVQTADSGYLFSGQQLIKFDKAGLVQWYRWEYGGTAIQTKDGGYLLSGSNKVDSAGYQAAQILKLDGAGELQWQFAFSRLHEYQSASRAVMAIELSDGYLIGGYHISLSPGGSPTMFLVKISFTGQPIWERNIIPLSSNPAYLSKIIVTADGGIVIAGTTVISSNFKNFDADIICIKCTPTGIPQWVVTVDAFASESSIGLFEATDGSLVIAGRTIIDSVGGILMTTIRGDGELKSARRMHPKGFEVKPNAMIPLASDKFLLAGVFKYHTNGMFVASSDALCSMQDILIQMTTPGVTIDSTWLKDTIRIVDRRDVFYTTLQSASQTGLCSSLANSTVAPMVPSVVSIAPNPVVSSAPITLYCSAVITAGYYEILLRDALGKEMYREQKYLRGPEEKIVIPVSDLPNGLFTVELVDANSFTSVWRGKVVKSK